MPPAMRIGPFEFLQPAFDSDHFLLIEHREGVVSLNHEGCKKDRDACGDLNS
jgi:hypothetical protein